MEPPARPHGPRSAGTGTGTVTVAELLARYAGAAPPPAPPARGVNGAVSVAALLRREGRGPHMADRPLMPRGHARAPAATPEPPRRSVRKATAAAGALFAATAVLGPSVVHDGGGRMPGTDIPLPLAGVPGFARYDGADDTAETGGTAPEGLAAAAVRQLFAEAVPSDVDGLDDLLAGSTAGTGQDLPTPGGAQTGATGPGAPGSGTVPPGGAGTPLGGIWSWPLGPSPVPEVLDLAGGSSGVGVALSAPTLRTPVAQVPSAGAELPVVGPVRTPAVTAGADVVDSPAISAAVGRQGVEVATTPGVAGLPDVEASGAQVGPLATSGVAVTTPDVEISGARVALSAEAPEVELPGVSISGTTIDTPDLALGAAEVALPDVELPGIELPGLRVAAVDEADGVDGADGADGADGPDGGEVTGTVDALAGTVTGLGTGRLGGGTAADRSDETDGADEAGAEDGTGEETDTEPDESALDTLAGRDSDSDALTDALADTLTGGDSDTPAETDSDDDRDDDRDDDTDTITDALTDTLTGGDSDTPAETDSDDATDSDDEADDEADDDEGPLALSDTWSRPERDTASDDEAGDGDGDGDGDGSDTDADSGTRDEADEADDSDDGDGDDGDRDAEDGNDEESNEEGGDEGGDGDDE